MRQREAAVAPGLGGDVVLARPLMERVLEVSPCTAERHALRGLRGRHRQGGERALGALAARVGWSSVVVGGQRHVLEGGREAARR